MSAPAVIDSFEFARNGEKLSGTLPVAHFSRLQDLVADNGGDLSYEIVGGHDARQRPQLMLRVRGVLELQCQRCLGPLRHVVDFENTVLVMPEGATPDDAQEPDGPDYIEAQREMDVASLVEDEVLLQLPFAPRHEGKCASSEQAAVSRGGKESPFAVLAALKNTKT